MQKTIESNPNVARTMTEFATIRQLRAIRIRCAAKGLNVEAESSRLMGCELRNLSRKAASKLIQALEAM